MDTRHPAGNTTTIFHLLNDNFEKEIFVRLDIDSIINFIRTSKLAYLGRFDAIYQAIINAAKPLFIAAASGEWAEVDNLLQTSPHLLTCSATIQNNRRYKYVNCTVFKIALINDEDISVLRMLADHFKKLPDGKVEMMKQIYQVFPEGKQFKEGWDIEKAKRLHDDVFINIINDGALKNNNSHSVNFSTWNALNTFYAYAVPKQKNALHIKCTGYFRLLVDTMTKPLFHHITVQPNEFSRGLNFDSRLLMHIMQNIDENFGRFTTWEQILFYCVYVWDYLVDILPTSDLRAMGQGIEYLTGTANETLQLNGCKLRDGTPMLPLSENFFPGEKYINTEGKQISVMQNSFLACKRESAHTLWKKYKDKKQGFDQFLKEIQEPSAQLNLT